MYLDKYDPISYCCAVGPLTNFMSIEKVIELKGVLVVDFEYKYSVVSTLPLKFHIQYE